MIKQLEIVNIQSHKHSVLDFSPGVNVIIGTTDSGKSAIIRSLRLCFFNKPTGDGYRSNWGGDSKSIVTFKDGKLARIRSKSFNGYVLGASEYKALKGEVPKEIRDFLNIDSINLQQQGDSFFLLSNTSGEVAQHFNKIAKLDTIAIGMKNIKSWTESISKKLYTFEEDLKEKEKALTDFIYLDKFEAEIEVLEDSEKKLFELRKNKSQIEKIIEALIENEQTQDSFSDLSPISDLLNDIEVLQKEKDVLVNNVQNLNFLIADIKQNAKKGKTYNMYIKIEPGLKEIDSLILEQKTITENKNKLNRTVKALKEVTREHLFQSQLYSKAHAEFEKQMPDICPLCNK